MYLEPNNPSLSFADFLEAAIRDKTETNPFPYTLEVCRCRYCSYCKNGKCALKRCCCMSERVKARSCTFAELLRDCFANFKDNVFQYRLRLACERASELKTCFLDAGHRGRFYEGVSYMRKKDPTRVCPRATQNQYAIWCLPRKKQSATWHKPIHNRWNVKLRISMSVN